MWLRPHLKGTTQKFAPLGLLREIPLPVPPISEQRRIVAEVERRLSIADEMKAQAEASLHSVERLRRAILKWAFEGELGLGDTRDEPVSRLLSASETK
jgi:type I restriction enzyme S subunit